MGRSTQRPCSQTSPRHGRGPHSLPLRDGMPASEMPHHPVHGPVGQGDHHSPEWNPCTRSSHSPAQDHASAAGGWLTKVVSPSARLLPRPARPESSPSPVQACSGSPAPVPSPGMPMRPGKRQTPGAAGSGTAQLAAHHRWPPGQWEGAVAGSQSCHCSGVEGPISWGHHQPAGIPFPGAGLVHVPMATRPLLVCMAQ